MIETPEARRIRVFRRGTLKGLIIIIFKGGHREPSSILGERE